MQTQRLSLPLLTALFFSVGPHVSPAPSATLEKLSNDRLIAESTEIVRATVLYCANEFRRPLIYTICELNVTERLKGPAASRVQVAIPGGVAAGYRQTIEGAPTLQRNAEYLFFLWQGKSGLKQIMGLSQGMMNVVRNADGSLELVRAKSEDRMVDANGKPIEDSPFAMRYNEMAAKVRAKLTGATLPKTGVRQ
jgi:hypothetical protein